MDGHQRSTPAATGRAAEDRALKELSAAGLRLVARNFRCRLGEIDLVMRDADTLVFVEVRSRARSDYGGAAASVGPAKQHRLRREAQRYLNEHFGDHWPPCRFDVCALEGAGIDWIRDAF